jgi:hypothetical protein
MHAVIQVRYETLSGSVESFFQELLRLRCHSGIEIPVISYRSTTALCTKNVCVRVAAQFALEDAMKAQRGSRVVALLFL